MPGSIPPTSQLDWLISTTAMIVLFWSRATRDLLKACPGAGRGRSAGASRHSIGYMQRRSCHFLAARPIASLGPAWGLGRLRAGTAGWTSVANRVGISSIVSRLTPFGYSFNYIQGLVDGASLRDIADWLLEREALMSEARTLELEEIKKDPTDVHVFISYSHEDFGIAQCLQEELTAVNPDRVRCFLDAYSIRSGEEWHSKIIANLKAADWLVFLYTGRERRPYDFCGFEIGGVRGTVFLFPPLNR